jgi:hypothetical protein
MSRGGGSWRGGRGRGRGGGESTVAGVALRELGWDPDLKPDFTPNELFPVSGQ